MISRFGDRAEAGRLLARELSEYAGRTDVLVLGLPRGGVPVAFEVARALGAPLDVFVVRKLGVPGQEELAMGAIASGGVRVVNEALRRLYGTPEKFGHCHQCGQEINFERLDALPHARLCITCKEKEEDGKRR